MNRKHFFQKQNKSWDLSCTESWIYWSWANTSFHINRFFTLKGFQDNVTKNWVLKTATLFLCGGIFNYLLKFLILKQQHPKAGSQHSVMPLETALPLEIADGECHLDKMKNILIIKEMPSKIICNSKNKILVDSVPFIMCWELEMH